jgi:hypothetical protein
VGPPEKKIYTTGGDLGIKWGNNITADLKDGMIWIGLIRLRIGTGGEPL